jgi:hypothetical protein
LALTFRAIIGYLFYLNPDFGEKKSYDALKHWCSWFLKINSLVFRKTGHIWQPLILSIARNGDKLAHMMIFKGQPDKTIEKHLQKIDDIINKKIFVYCQQN